MYLLRFLTLSILCLCGITTPIHAQQLDSTQAQMRIEIPSYAFFYNNEYFGKYTKGFTSPGFIILPQYQHTISNLLSYTIGIYYRQYGDDTFRASVKPFIQVDHQIAKHHNIIIGMLQGGKQHHLSEGMYRFDRFYQEFYELGIQHIYHTNSAHSDTWIDWDRFLEKGDDAQERFYIGHTGWIQKNIHARLKVKIDDEVLLSHTGGQIDSSDKPVINTANASLGINLIYMVNPTFEITSELRAYVSNGRKYFEDFKSPQVEGYAWNPNFAINYYKHKWLIGWWYGNNYTSPTGERLLLSNSDFKANNYTPERNVIFGEYLYELGILHSKIDARVKLYFDLIEQRFDYTFGVVYFVNPTVWQKNISQK